jgi:hypothetical protein
MRAKGRISRVAWGVLFAGMCAVGFAPSANAASFLDTYYGGIDNLHPTSHDLIGTSNFEVSSVRITPVGLGLGVTIYSNFINHIGEDNVQLGALFLGNTADLNLTGPAPYGTDTFVGDEGRFKYAVTVDGGGASTVYALNGTGSDVQISNVNGITTSPAGSFWFREDQAVGVNNTAVANGSGITANYFVNTVASDGITTGALTFNISNIFGPGLLNDAFTLAWTMTCGNDVILVSTVINHENPPPVPLPASLPLFAGGLGLIGWVSSKRRRKARAATGA